jgi:uncharacterized membrane protein (DUF485 family)
MRSYYPGITLFKLWGCIMVVFGHEILAHDLLGFPNQQLRFLTLMLSNIVPCFYVVSGFLAYKGWSKATHSGKYVFNYIRWILLVYTLFSIAFIVEFNIPALVHGGDDLVNILNQLKILFVAVVLNGPYLQLWFIPPLLFGVGISYWFLSHNWQRPLLTIAILGFLLSLFIRGTFQLVLPDSSFLFSFKYTEYVALFLTRYFGFGLTFVLMGVLVAKYESLFIQSKLKTWAILSVLMAVVEALILIEFANWNSNYVLAISFLPSTLLIFQLLLKIKLNRVKTYHKFINLFSMVTYFGHILIMRFNSAVLNWQTDNMTVIQGIIFFLLTLTECWMITYLLTLRTRYSKSYNKKRLAS